MASTAEPNVLEAPREWKDFLEGILPPQGAWTEEQYLVLTESSSQMIEFTDGYLEAIPVPTDRHQSILKFLLLAFVNFVEPRGGVVQFAPLRLRIRRGKFREPDLLLFLRASDPRRENRFWDGADLALEVVSEDQPERDLIDKRTDYAEARVPEYWIVNPEAETVSVLRLHNNIYVEAGEYQRGQMASSILLPGLSIDVAGIFDAGSMK